MANLRPASTAIPGTLTLTLKETGEALVLKDTFFWIVACLRNPYNGCLGEPDEPAFEAQPRANQAPHTHFWL